MCAGWRVNKFILVFVAEEKMPTGINIGPIPIHFYGVILMLGALSAAFLAEREARRRGINSDLVWDGLIWVLIGGIIGARIWHILTPPPSSVDMGYTAAYYLTHPLDALAVWRGGLGIPGAVLGGLAALYIFSRRRKLQFATWTDIAAPALALGQAIGRWGNFINQELYGRPTDLPWAITIDPQYRVQGFEQFSRFHPLFLYESIWNFANMAFLLWLARNHQERLKPGDVFLSYLVIYPVGRFLLEFLRLDAAEVAGINANQTFMVIVAVAAGIALFLRHRSGAKTVQEESTSKAG
jgi:phosphatidylglycerol---prolipoprotein diacylglyceryl transferase